MRNRRSEMQYPDLRVTMWRVVLEILKTTHYHRFPGRRFGTDLGVLMVYGAAMTTYLQGRKVRASVLAKYLQMPHETARRYLKEIVKLGLLEPEDHTFRPTSKSAKGFDPSRLTRLIKDAAHRLM